MQSNTSTKNQEANKENQPHTPSWAERIVKLIAIVVPDSVVRVPAPCTYRHGYWQQALSSQQQSKPSHEKTA